MALSPNELKAGLTVLVNNIVYLILSVDHVKPGKGAAFSRAKLRDLKTGNVLEKTFRNEQIQEAFVEKKPSQFTYKSGDDYHFMDQETFEEIIISKEQLADNVKFLKDNLVIDILCYKDEILNINLPNFIEFKVIATEPGIKGDTAKSSGKPATIETGAEIQVPLFINIGDIIKIDTRTGEYLGRV
ncbi:MAG: elongation factor P [Candidatus Omnitrophota bacterium]